MDVEKDLQDIIERYQSRRKLRNVVNKYNERRKGRLKARRELDRADERWITVGAKEENKRTGEPGHKGKHVLIDDEGVVVAGAGGSLTGTKLGGAKSTSGEVKVDPSKTTGEVGESKKGEEAPPPKPKVPKWGDFEQKEEDKQGVEKANELLSKLREMKASKDPWSYGKVHSLAKDVFDAIPHGAVVELNGKEYFMKKGWLFSKERPWDGLFFGNFANESKYTEEPGFKYIGSFEPDKTPLPAADKKIEFEGNLGEKYGEIWDKIRSRLTYGDTHGVPRLIAKLVTTSDGTTVTLDDGTLFQKNGTGWTVQEPGAKKAKKAKEWNDDLRKALVAGNVKSISAKAETYSSKGSGDYAVSVDNGFVLSYGVAEYTELHDKVMAVEDKEAASLWKNTENKLEVYKSSKAYYSPGTWMVHLDSTLKPASYMPFEVAFHEGGHAIDWNAARQYDPDALPTEPLSMIYKGRLLPKTMSAEWKEGKAKLEEAYREKRKEEVEAVKKQLHDEEVEFGKPKAETIQKLEKQGFISWMDSFAVCYKGEAYNPDMIKTPYADAERMLQTVTGKKWAVYGDVLDMFHMSSKGKFGSGHTKTYAKDGTNAPTEFFAEAFSATMCNPESLELIKTYFPKSYEVFKEIKQWLAKNFKG